MKGGFMAANFDAEDIYKPLTDYLEGNCFARIEQVSRQFKLDKRTIEKHLGSKGIKSFIEFRKSFICRALTEYINNHPGATAPELAKHFKVGQGLIGHYLKTADLRKPLMESNLDVDLARYIRQHSNAKEEELVKHFLVHRGVIRRHLPNGIPLQWTEKIVEDLLDECVLQFGDKLVPGSLTKRAKYLDRAFYKFKLYKKYPLHYWKFNVKIYPLFGIDMPEDYEEEWQMQWPDQKILRTRYRELLKIHHPDRYHYDPLAARIAHFKFRWIVKAYSHLLKRHKRLTIGEPPPVIKQMSVHPVNNGKVISP